MTKKQNDKSNHIDIDDPLIKEIKMTNPIDASGIEGPGSARASEVYARATDSGGNPLLSDPPQAVTVGEMEMPDAQVARPQGSGPRRYRWVMGAGVACLTLLIGSAMLFTSNKPAHALAEAAAAAESADSGVITISQPGCDECVIQFAYNGSRLSADVANLNARDGQYQGIDGEYDALFIDDMMYIRSEVVEGGFGVKLADKDEWVAIGETGGTILAQITERAFSMIRPTKIFELVKSVAEVENLGYETVDGKRLEVFSGAISPHSVDLDKLGIGGVLGEAIGREFYPGSGSVKLTGYLDEGTLVKLVISEDESDESIHMSFADFGKVEMIKAPAQATRISFEDLNPRFLDIPDQDPVSGKHPSTWTLDEELEVLEAQVAAEVDPEVKMALQARIHKIEHGLAE